MRCPKCGYNSFDHFDSCKKCGKDLVEFKRSHGIESVLFPGQMRPSSELVEAKFGSEAVDVVTTATEAIVPEKTAIDEPLPDQSDGDDFGFDFIGGSAEEDALSFDELFEEAPESEDVEERIEGSRTTAADEIKVDPELEDSFGFEPTDDFSFDDDDFGITGSSGKLGTKEGPPRPFDLPESLPIVGVPETEEAEKIDFFVTDTDVVEATAENLSNVVTNPDELGSDLEYSFFASSKEPANVTEQFEPTEQLVAQVDADKKVAVVAAIVPPIGNCIMAFLYDVAILAIVGTGFILSAEAAMATQRTRLIPSLNTLVDLSIPYFLVLFFLTFGYFTLFHFLAGQTPGKMLTGLRVETVTGEPLFFAQAFLRSVGGLLQLLPVGIGYLLFLISSERRGWNDRLAGTRVVVLRD